MASEKRWPMVLVDVGTQNDLMNPAGCLYVDGAEAILPQVRLLFDWARRLGMPVISAVDEHAMGDEEFRRLPPHCVAGTWGQQKIDGTVMDRRIVIGMKDSQVAFPAALETYQQVIFSKTTRSLFEHPQATAAIRAINADCFVVFGVASDYCVRSAVEGLLGLKKPTAIVVDAVEAMDKTVAQAVMDKLMSAGATLTTAAEVMSMKV